jgi:hypothetical protein
MAAAKLEILDDDRIIVGDKDGLAFKARTAVGRR